MLRTFVGLAAAAALTAAPPLAAQDRWSAELDAGAALPTGRLAGAELETGVGLGANLRVRVQPHLAVYAGWEWHRFGTDGLLGASGLDVEDTGYTLGLRFEHPLRGRTAGWVRLGGLVNHIELEDDAGDVVGDSGHGLGFEVGAGLAIPIGARVALTPGVRYRSLTRDLEVGAARQSATLSYVRIGSGIAIRF